MLPFLTFAQWQKWMWHTCEATWICSQKRELLTINLHGCSPEGLCVLLYSTGITHSSWDLLWDFTGLPPNHFVAPKICRAFIKHRRAEEHRESTSLYVALPLRRCRDMQVLTVPSHFKQNSPVLSLASCAWELMARIWPRCGVCLQAERWWEASCGMWESGWTAEVMQGMLNVSPAGRELRLKHKLQVLGIAECSRHPRLPLPSARRPYKSQMDREEN